MKYEDAGYIDLDHDDHSFEVDGKPLTEADAERLGEEIAQKHRAKRAAMGRPSLTAPGEKSPTINARVPRPLKDALQARAHAEGVGEAALVRRALEAYLAKS